MSRLENKQFNDPIEINLTELIKQRLNYFSDFTENKKLSITTNFAQEVVIKMQESLSEILIDNLFKNAIQHNTQNGNILVTIQNNTLCIANSGIVPKDSTDKYFERFHSQTPNQSLGLGLSIAKKIVEYYGYSINYNYHNDLHTIVVDFNQNIKTT